MTNRALLVCWVYCQRKYDYCLQLYATFLRHRRFDEAVKTIDIQLIEDVAQSFNGNDNDNGKILEATEHIEQIVNSIGEVMIKYGK